MKKLVLALLILFWFFHSSYASSCLTTQPQDWCSNGNQCDQNFCYLQAKIKVLEIQINNLEKESNKDKEFELEKKILEYQQKISENKENAYDRALNDLNFWLKLFWGILTVLWATCIGWFWFKSWPEFKKETKKDIKSELSLENQSQFAWLKENLNNWKSEKFELLHREMYKAFDDLNKDIYEEKEEEAFQSRQEQNIEQVLEPNSDLPR